jgi:hypothetical protein
MSRNDKNYYAFDAVVRETDKGVCLRFGDDEIWFPKSQVDFDIVRRELSCPEWLAVEKGIEGYEC